MITRHDLYPRHAEISVHDEVYELRIPMTHSRSAIWEWAARHDISILTVCGLHTAGGNSIWVIDVRGWDDAVLALINLS